MPILNLQVSNASYDGGETEGGTVALNGTTIRLRSGAPSRQFQAGARFVSVTIPQGATISSATFSLWGTATSANMVSQVSAQANDNAATFTNSPSDISARTRSAANVSWSATFTSGAFNSVGVTSIVQEIINRPGWSSGNSLVILLDDFGGDCTFETYDSNSAHAPKLDITYSTGGGGGGSARPSAFIMFVLPTVIVALIFRAVHGLMRMARPRLVPA